MNGIKNSDRWGPKRYLPHVGKGYFLEQHMGLENGGNIFKMLKKSRSQCINITRLLRGGLLSFCGRKGLISTKFNEMFIVV